MKIIESGEDIVRNRFAADSTGNALRVSDLCMLITLS
jgi:hypothetical protein